MCKALQRKLGALQYSTTRAMATEQPSPPTIAERLQALAEAVEKFAQAVDNGEIAPPRKKNDG